MGSSASKGARAAAGASTRKYPSRTPNATTRPAAAPVVPQAPRVGPSVHPLPPQASGSKTDAIDLDARDPAFASRLNSIGVVQPNPHYSPTSTSAYDPQRNTSSSIASDMMDAPPRSAFPDPRDNPALRALEARERIQAEADEELSNVGRRGFQGRKYVDAGIIQLALMRRQRGEPEQRIEDALGIKRGRLSTLSKQGIVEAVQM